MVVINKIFMDKTGENVVAVEILDKSNGYSEIMLNKSNSTFSSLVMSNQVENAKWNKGEITFIGKIQRAPYFSMCAKFEYALQENNNFLKIYFDDLMQALCEMKNNIDYFEFYFVKAGDLYRISTDRALLFSKIVGICRKNPELTKKRLMFGAVDSTGGTILTNITKEVVAELSVRR